MLPSQFPKGGKARRGHAPDARSACNKAAWFCMLALLALGGCEDEPEPDAVGCPLVRSGDNISCAYNRLCGLCVLGFQNEQGRSSRLTYYYRADALDSCRWFLEEEELDLGRNDPNGIWEQWIDSCRPGTKECREPGCTLDFSYRVVDGVAQLEGE